MSYNCLYDLKTVQFHFRRLGRWIEGLNFPILRELINHQPISSLAAELNGQLIISMHSADNSSLSGIITQAQSDGTQILPKSHSSFAFRWLSAICSCFHSSETEFRSLSYDASCEILLPPQNKKFEGMKTLILDLDETLVHSSFKPPPKSDMIIPVEVDGRNHPVFVGKRPGVDDFLEHVGRKFEVVIFTASLSKVRLKQYANPLIDKLDTYSVVSSRLFRESCVLSNGVYVKDLSKIGRDLAQTVIIDVRPTQNSPMSYSFQPENAIPILTWLDDPDDVELYKLLPVLDQLAKAKDVASFRAKVTSRPNTPLTPAIIESVSEDIENTLSAKESSERILKSQTEGPDLVKIEADRSDLNSPVNRSYTHAFKFDEEE